MVIRNAVALLLCASLPSFAQTTPPAGTPALNSAAVHRPDQPAKAILARWFRGYEFVPTDADFARLGPRLGGALRDLAGDPNVDLIARVRAVSAMVYATEPATAQFVAALLADSSAASVLRRKAALVLGERLGPEAIPGLVSAFYGAPDDVYLREACAKALGRLGAASRAVRERLRSAESSPTVRAFLADAKRLGDTP